MVYEIDESCLQLLNAKDENCILFFEQLALDRRKCKNILIAKRHIFASLAKETSLSSVARQLYNILGKRVSEQKMILDRTPRYCKIVADYDGESVIKDAGKRILLVKASESAYKDLTSKSIMLAENEDDISFYKLLGRYYVQTNDLGNIAIDFDSRNGGGSTICNVLKGIIQEKNRMCLCIVDSDKKYGGATPGGTMSRVKEIVDGVCQEYFEVVFLGIHEIENLIPMNIIEDIINRIGSKSNGLEFMKFLIAKDDSRESPIFYFDIKRGIPRNAFCLDETADEEAKRRYRGLELYRNYWRAFVEEFGVDFEGEGDKLVAGICERTLEHAMTCFEVIKQKPKPYFLDSYLEEVWNEIGEKVYCWGCVGARVAV